MESYYCFNCTKKGIDDSFNSILYDGDNDNSITHEFEVIDINQNNENYELEALVKDLREINQKKELIISQQVDQLIQLENEIKVERINYREYSKDNEKLNEEYNKLMQRVKVMEKQIYEKKKK